VVENIRASFQYCTERISIAEEIRYQEFHEGFGCSPPDFFNRLREQAGSTVTQIIAGY
jgi:hypothetical protein